MRDTQNECMRHGRRSNTDVCPFCMVGILLEDKAKLKEQNAELRLKIKQMEEACTSLLTK